jgi:hypothetical protein
VRRLEPVRPPGGDASSAGANESDAGDDRSDPEATNRLPRRRIGLQSQRIERRADTSSAGADIPVPEAGGRIPPQASSTPTRAAGRPSRRADRRSWRTTRGANASSSECAGRRLQQAVAAAERTPPHAQLPDAPRSGRLGGRIEPNQAPSSRFAGRWNGPVPRATISRAPQRPPRPEHAVHRPSKQILIPVSAACEPSSPCQFTVPSYPSSMRSFGPIITLQRRSAHARTRAPIGRACACTFMEHAMFRVQHQDRAAALLRDLQSRLQGLAHVMHLRPRDRHQPV